MQLREMFENEWTNWRRRQTFNNVKSFTRSNSSSSSSFIINRLISITLVHLFISLALVNLTTAATATAQSGVSSQSPSLSKLKNDMSSKVSTNPKIIGRNEIMMSNRSITMGVLGKNVTGMGKKSSLGNSAVKMASLKGKNKPRPIPTVTISPAKYSNQSNLLNNQAIGVNGSSSLIDDLAARNRRQLCKLGFRITITSLGLKEIRSTTKKKKKR